MSPSDRYAWIKSYLQKDSRVDILNREFVAQYAIATKPAVGTYRRHMAWHRSVGRDLSAMYAAGILTRGRVSLPEMSGMGFPKWVYVYSLRVQP